MGLVQAAYNQVKRYGAKGNATLRQITGASFDPATNRRTSGSVTDTDLLCYLVSSVNGKQAGINVSANSDQVLAVPDADWDGSIELGSKMVIDGVEHDIVSFRHYDVRGVLAYVEINING